MLTENQIEKMVAPETRRIKLPGGNSRLHTMDRLSWLRLDEMVDVFSADEVVALTCGDCERTGRPFELMLPSIIEYITRESNRRSV